ncbi:hypothetical protein RSO68_15705 [Halomonas saccharevitans]|uniref:Tubulin/FtsZ GTPase domain-containing protein n=1 Tax=Halomonas saccharevitans TaxID=416872 RepID=A0ABU3NK62_9GAMM|nr:hypothetical protein [Halomonas saccharevitans]MDT8880913.1 hypothetical protein [Halomonas saccharevitans]
MSECTVIGIGGAGLQLAWQAQRLVGGVFLAINTDQEPLASLPPGQQLVIGPQCCGGKGASSPARGRLAAEESLSDIRARLPDSGKVVLMAGLGGGAGTGALSIVANEAIQRGLEPLIAVTLPFRLESERREEALSALKELEATGATIITHDHAQQHLDSIDLESVLQTSATELARRSHAWIKGETDA